MGQPTDQPSKPKEIQKNEEAPIKDFIPGEGNMQYIKKLDNYEIQRIESLKQKEMQITHQLGTIRSQQLLLDKQAKSIEEQFDILQQEKSKYFEQIQEKYGKIQLDIDTYEYTEVEE